MKERRRQPSNPPDASTRSGEHSDRLFVESYEELRQLAARQLKSETALTIQPTALVHEVYLRLGAQRQKEWLNRSQFMANAATMMRQVLIDQARKARANRRGAGWKRVDIDPAAPVALETPEDAIWLGELLDRLAHRNQRQASILELRLFAGLTVPEVAEALQVSARTVEADWTLIRTWVRQQLADRDH